MGDYRDLLAWQLSRTLAQGVYRATESFPLRERFGLAVQMRRAAISVMSNIAEGASRGSDRELRRFLLIARGSLAELQSQLMLALDLHLMAAEYTEPLTQASSETARVLHGLLRSYPKSR